MKKQAAFLFALIFSTAVSNGQGTLTPTNAPAPSMKSLNEIHSAVTQVEARIPISEAGLDIRESGSYYLTCNIVAEGAATPFKIWAKNVTIDLNGYAIDGAASTASSIIAVTANATHFTLKNGTLCNSERHGVYTFGAQSCIFKDLLFKGNGRNSTSAYALDAGERAVVENCLFENNEGGAALFVVAESRVLNNRIVGNSGTGLKVSGDQSLIAENEVRGNGRNHDITGNNQINLLLSEIPEIIDFSCSVKLAGSLTCSLSGTNGITVAADNITIDMAGHTLYGPGAESGSGIYQANTFKNIRVHNGKVQGWQNSLSAGIKLLGNGADLEHLQATGNYIGLWTAGNTVFAQCTASDNTSNGIFCGSDGTLSACSAKNNGVYGIQTGSGSSLTDCSAYGNTNHGILVMDGSTVSKCASRNNGRDGIFAYSGALITDSTFSRNTGDGIQLMADSRVHGCTASNNGENVGNGIGINITQGGNVINQSLASNNQSYGIRLQGTAGQDCNHNRITDCIVRANASYGMYLVGNGGECNGNIIRNCTVSKNVTYGIYMEASSENWIDGNHIAHQVIDVAGGLRTVWHFKYDNSSTNNVIVRNVTFGESSFVYNSNNMHGPYGPTTGSTADPSPWAQFRGE